MVAKAHLVATITIDGLNIDAKLGSIVMQNGYCLATACSGNNILASINPLVMSFQNQYLGKVL